MKRSTAVVALLAVGLLLVAPVPAQTIRYVSGSGIDAGDCTEEANSCATVGYAMDQAEPGETISIAAGAYTEPLEINKSIILRGAGRDAPSATVIQAHVQLGKATSRVITIDGGFVVEISDLVIRHGVAIGSAEDGDGGGIFNRDAALTLVNVNIHRNISLAFGGGIAIYSASPTLTDVMIEENLSHLGSGGGMSAELSSSPVLTRVEFNGNEAGGSGGGMSNSGGTPLLVNVLFNGNRGLNGGGMFNSNGAPILTNVDFTENFAGGDGGGMADIIGSSVLTNVTFAGNAADLSGGGMYNTRTPELRSVTFRENHALGAEQDQGGGGMFSTGSDASPTLTNVRFIDNTAVRGGGMRVDNGDFQIAATLRNVRFQDNTASSWGGGMYVRESFPLLANVLFTGNEAGNGGGGMFNFTDAFPVLANVTFSGNHAPSGGGIRNDGTASPVLYNAIVWGNTASNGNEIANSGGAVWLEYSLYRNGPDDIPGAGFTCENCLTVDPRFLDPENGNLRLSEDSPAIDAGHPDTEADILDYFPTDANGVPVDLDGRRRIFGNAIDMGAYEWQPLGDAIFRDRFEHQ